MGRTEESLRRLAAAELMVQFSDVVHLCRFDDSPSFDSMKFLNYLMTIEKMFGFKFDFTDDDASVALSFRLLAEAIDRGSSVF